MSHRIRNALGIAAVAGCLGAFGTLALAQDAAGVIKYRQSVMSALGGHMGATARIVRGEVEFTDDLAAHAGALHDLSGMILQAFPDGSLEGEETEALPGIWEDWDGFTAAAETLQTATAELVTAVEGGDGDAIAAAFGEVGGACRNCHDNYRAE